MNNCKHLKWLATGAALLLWSAMSFAQGYPQTHPGTMGQPGAPGYPGTAGYPPQAGTMGNPMGTGDQMQDRTFMMKAAEGGLAEVQLGQLAQQNGQSQEVKDFGQRMVTDHSKANDELKEVAEKQGVTLPTSPNSHDQAEYDRLSKMHGDAFDKAYSKMMVSDHKKDIGEFKHEAASGNDPQVRSFASQTLPTLEEHLKLAEKMNKDEKSGSQSGTNGSSTQ